MIRSLHHGILTGNIGICGGSAGNGCRSERVDCALNGGVGDVEAGGLNTRRQTNADDLQQRVAMYFQLGNCQLTRLIRAKLLAKSANQARQTAHVGGNGKPRHAHAEPGNQQEIQSHVQNAGKC